MSDIESLKLYLKDQSFAVLCVAMNLGGGPEPVVIVKSTGDLLDSLRAAEVVPEAGWVVGRTDFGPVLCLVIRAQAEGVGSLAGETYFDPCASNDQELLGSMATRERIRIVFLDEDGEVDWVADMPWDEVRRLETEQVVDQTEQLLERVEGYDLSRAKERFQEGISLDDLVARAFPE